MAKIISKMLGLESVDYSLEAYSEVATRIETILELPTKKLKNVVIGSMAGIGLVGAALAAHAVSMGTEWVDYVVQAFMLDAVIGGTAGLVAGATKLYKNKLVDLADDMEKDAIIKTYNEFFGFDLSYDMDKNEIIDYIAKSMGLENKDVFPLAAIGLEVMDQKIDVRDFFSKIGNLVAEKANKGTNISVIENISADQKVIENTDEIYEHLDDFGRKEKLKSGIVVKYKQQNDNPFFDYDNDVESQKNGIKAQSDYEKPISKNERMVAFDYPAQPVQSAQPKIINVADLIKDKDASFSKTDNRSEIEKRSEIDKLFDDVKDGETREAKISIKDLFSPEK